MPKYLVQTPDPRFRGEIVGVTFTDGAAIVDTDTGPGAISAYAYFQRAAYSVTAVEETEAAEESAEEAAEPAPFDPGASSVADVLAYLSTADADEQARVLAAEAAGKNRTTILGGSKPAETDPQGAQS